MVVRMITVALRELLRQPVRTLLVLQGVIWGTALGVFPSALINGSMRQAEREAEQFGTDRLLLTQEQVEVSRPFDWTLVSRLRDELAGDVRALSGVAVVPGESLPLPLLLTDASVFAAQHLSMAAGRAYTADDVRAARAICVLQPGVVSARFEGRVPLGETVELLPELRAEVLGVTAPREAAAIDDFGYSEQHALTQLVDQLKRHVGTYEDEETAILTGDGAVLLPQTLLPDVPPRWIEVRADPRKILGLREQLRDRLTADGYEPVIYINAILPVLYGETISTLLELNRTVFVLCVTVGTAIVCALMVLSVVERQREIAIRRVEGARKWHIAWQFIVETGTLCTVGGVLGVPLGILLAIVRCAIEPLASVTWAFPLVEVLLLVGAVSLVGLVGGLIPALRAMSVDPVEMLRYE
jgi:putative ABC transport system permease protein